MLLFFKKQGIPVGSLSELIRQMIVYFSRICVDNWGAEEILSSESATNILKEHLPKSQLNYGGRLLPSYMKNLQLEETLLDKSPRPDMSRQEEFVEQTQENIESQTDRALAEFRRMLREEKEK